MLYGAGGAPDGYTVVGAASSIDFSAGVGSGWFELWGTPGASRTRGSWFAVNVQPHTGLGLERNAERVQIGPVIGMRSTSTDGVRTVRFPVGDDSIAINSWGWADDALMNLAATLSLQGGRPVFGDTSFQTDHRLLAGGPSNQPDLDGQLFTNVTTMVTYRRESDQQTLTVINSAADTNNDTVLPFVVAPIPGMVTSGPNTFFLVAGRAVMFASIPGRDNQTIGRWTEDGVTVDATLAKSWPSRSVWLLGPPASKR